MTTNPFSVYNPRSIINVTNNYTFPTENPQQLQNKNTAIGKFMFSDSTDKDSFYRLRISEPYTLYDGDTIYDSNPLFFDYQFVSGKTSNTGPSGGMMTHTINSNASVGDFASQQTHYYAHYQPGKSLLAMFSFLFGSPIFGITRRVGFYDINSSNNFNPRNGILLEQTSEGIFWNIYQGSPGNLIRSIPQKDWNIDTFDGKGPSGVTLDFTKTNLGFIDMEWLGVGRVRCGFFVNGVPLVANVFNNTDQTSPYINSPYLPIRYEIRKTDITSSSASMNAICCSIVSEGGFNPTGIVTTFSSKKSVTSTPSDETILLSLRLKSSYSRCIIIPELVEITTELTGSSFIILTIYCWRNNNYDVPGTWTSVSSDGKHYNSIAEYTTYNFTPTEFTTNGTRNILYQTTFLSSTKFRLSDIPLSLISIQSNVDDLYRDIIVLSITGISSNNKDFTTYLTWKEIY